MIRRCVGSLIGRQPARAVVLSSSSRVAKLTIGMVGFESRRHMSTSDSTPRMAPAEALKVLHGACEKELCEEQASDRIDVPVPEGWTYHHTPGSGYFTLHRDIPFPMEIFCRVEDPNTDGETPGSYTFLVRMIRNQRTCELKCLAREDELEIHGYRVFAEVRSRDDFLKSDPYFESELMYQGPDLEHMDETFLQTLMESLESFGINDALASYVFQRCEATEQQEYEKWLSDLKQFTA